MYFFFFIDREEDDLLELIAGMQSKRMDEQRVTLPYLPGLNTNPKHQATMKTPVRTPQDADDSFIDMVLRCQSSRLEDQRSPLPAASIIQDAEEEPNQRSNGNNIQSTTTVPEEDLFALIQRLQAGRMEDQRASGPGKYH